MNSSKVCDYDMKTGEHKTFEALVKYESLVLVDFYAGWCVPCKMMTPILHQLKDSVGSKIRILKVDVDANFSVITRYHVKGVPTLILFKQGKMIWRKSGFVLHEELLQIIERSQ